MAFQGVAWVDINTLRPTQLYLSQKKIAGVSAWFEPSMPHFDAVPVRDFLGDGEFYITDGHTRVFVAWKAGVTRVPIVYDDDVAVTRSPGWAIYQNSIAWCRRFGIDHIRTLQDRILRAAQYETLWIDRCGRLENLEAALAAGRIDAAQLWATCSRLKRAGLFVYGASEDLRVLHCEDGRGTLYRIDSGFRPDV
ncbi:MAG: hypothetical protein PHO66_07555 [Eubacteriales bacterium]|nr:hypothetical protein [Eubacteriales bacterium]